MTDLASAGIETFKCVPLRAQVSARQCAANHRASQPDAVPARGVARRFGLVACRDCETGANNNATGFDVPLERFRKTPPRIEAQPKPATTSSPVEEPMHSPEARATAIADVVERNLNPKDVATAYGVTATTVYKWLRLAGHGRRATGKRTSDEDRKIRSSVRVASEIVQPEVRAVRLTRDLIVELLEGVIPKGAAVSIFVNDKELASDNAISVRFEVVS